MILELRRESRIPLYLQIATQVRDMIARGTLKVGDRLPPNRELAEILGVNRTTVTTAYAELEADGIINSHVGRGTFVKAVPAASKKATKKEEVKPSILWSALLADHKPDVWLNALLDSAQRRDTISLAYGLPQADLFPLDDFRRSVDRVIRREGRTLLQLGMASGYAPLREFLASHMAASGVAIKPDEVLITNGCQQSLDLIRRVLVGEGDEVVIENPTYPGAISVFCGNSAKYITVPVGSSGMDLSALEEILSKRGGLNSSTRSRPITTQRAQL